MRTRFMKAHIFYEFKGQKLNIFMRVFKILNKFFTEHAKTVTRATTLFRQIGFFFFQSYPKSTLKLTNVI